LGRGDIDFCVVDITDPTRALIRYLDNRLDDLSYRPDMVIQKQATWGRRSILNGNCRKLAEELRSDGVFPSISAAEVAADYLLDVYYPALNKVFSHVGLTAAAVHLVRLTISDSRQIHARVLVACI
jgi:hypothetical protein